MIQANVNKMYPTTRQTKHPTTLAIHQQHNIL